MRDKIIEFHKMQGSGNDFVLIDNTKAEVAAEAMSEWAAKICPRCFSVGADGLIFLESPPSGRDLAFQWRFFNSDGSRAEMCGNASRCAAKLAVELGLAGLEHSFLTDAGPIRAKVAPDLGRVKVELTPPADLLLNFSLNVLDKETEMHFVNTGVPHAVMLLDDVSTADVKNIGAAVRYHEHFAPKGTNVNFAQIKDRKNIQLRTYERGVENETLACGTGAAATGLIAHSLGLVEDKVDVTTTGGEVLTIYIESGVVFLEGRASKVYRGELSTSDLGLPE